MKIWLLLCGLVKADFADSSNFTRHFFYQDTGQRNDAEFMISTLGAVSNKRLIKGCVLKVLRNVDGKHGSRFICCLDAAIPTVELPRLCLPSV